jgi:hypothetical protein
MTAEKQLERGKTSRLVLYFATSPTGAAASSNSLIFFAETFVRDPNYDDSQSFSDMVSNINIYLGFLLRLETAIRRLYSRLLPNDEDARLAQGCGYL